MPEQEFNIEIHGTMERKIAGSECHQAPLVPGAIFQCPGCEQTYFVCSQCKQICSTVVVGTQEVKF